MTEAMLSLFPKRCGKRFAFPITIMTAIVSPMARPIAKIMDIMIFFQEAGSTIVAIAYHLEIPIASAQGRYSSFTLSIVSLQEDTRMPPPLFD